MEYKHRQLANTLLKYPYLNKYLQDVYTYYMLPENILYSISNKKNYKVEYEIMVSMLQLFMEEVEHEQIYIGNSANLINIMYKEALNISVELIAKLQKIYPEGDYLSLKLIDTLPLKEKLFQYNKIIRNVNKTPKQFIITSYDDIYLEYNFDFVNLRKYIKLFYYTIQLYEHIFYSICEKDIKENFDKYRKYIDDFYGFLRHLAVSIQIDILNISSKDTSFFTVFHLNKAERYIEMAVVDIISCLIGFIVENINIEAELIHQLLAIKQKNFFNISVKSNKRIKDYLIWINYFEFQHNQQNIKDITEKLISMI